MERIELYWRGIADPSTEECEVRLGNDGMLAESLIRIDDHLNPYEVAYTLSCNVHFETLSLKLEAGFAGGPWQVLLERKKNGWWLNGKEEPALAACTDVDIVLTPLTNTLPIRRLNLGIGSSSIITTAYINVPEQALSACRQRYTRLTEDTWHYENVPNDFEAEIRVDEQGFVTHYPGLFERVLPPVSL